MKKQSKEVKTSGSEHREIMIEIDASKSTNGTGGGSIIEGSYTVYRCDAEVSPRVLLAPHSVLKFKGWS